MIGRSKDDADTPDDKADEGFVDYRLGSRFLGKLVFIMSIQQISFLTLTELQVANLDSTPGQLSFDPWHLLGKKG